MTAFKMNMEGMRWSDMIISIVSGNHLLPDNTKPLTELMLTYCQLDPKKQSLVMIELKFKHLLFKHI